MPTRRTRGNDYTAESVEIWFATKRQLQGRYELIQDRLARYHH